MKPIISVVIPFYNAEQHLEVTVENIISSTNLDIEIILIDDFSTDASPSLAGKLQSKYPFIHYFRLEKNSGAGVARNTAVNHCLGDYVLFFDADDSIHQGALDKLVLLATENSADVVVAAYEVSLNRSGEMRFMPSHDKKIFATILREQSSKMVSKEELTLLIQTFNYPWNKVFKTSFFKQNQLKFGSRRVQNDVLAHWMGLALSERTFITREKICTHYKIKTSGSITTIFDHRRFEIFESLKEVKSFLQSGTKIHDGLELAFTKFSLRLLYWVSLNMNPQYVDEWNRTCKKGLIELGLAHLQTPAAVLRIGFRNYMYILKLTKPDSALTLSLFHLLGLLKKFKKGH